MPSVQFEVYSLFGAGMLLTIPMPSLQKSEPKNNDFLLTGYEDLEISTQIVIRAALARGIAVEVLNRPAHFLRLQQGSHIEYIKEASKTRLDTYITFLIMEDKYVSKQLLEESAIPVPRGGLFTDRASAIEELSHRQARPTVIKPNSTNFGIGVHVFETGAGIEEYTEALDTAFAHDKSVIIEDFVSGEEYRFLVLAGECVAVCKRIPANVTGDGISSIQKLVEIKNRDIRRGRGHRTPLEIIEIDSAVQAHLAGQGLSQTSVPEREKTIFLRKNSNISTGGDSVDVTSLAHPSYKKIAVEAAKAAGASICGVDIITPDLRHFPASPREEAKQKGLETTQERTKETSKPPVAVLEINFNPVLYIHEFPYRVEGTWRHPKIGERILDALGFASG